MGILIALLTILFPIIFIFMYIIDFFMFYFGFMFQSATPLYTLSWIIIGLVTGPLSWLIAATIDTLSPAPIIGRVYTSGIFGKEKWIIRGED